MDAIAQIYRAAGSLSEKRVSNFPSEWCYRKDALYECLTKIRYSDFPTFKRFEKVAQSLVSKFPSDPSATAYAAYCAALSGRWSDAVSFMEETVRLEGAANLDSWMDLAHFLRKIPGREAESLSILLDPVSKVSP